MLGYDISWSAFNIIEVMSSNKFTYKVRKENFIFRKLEKQNSSRELVILLHHNVLMKEQML